MRQARFQLTGLVQASSARPTQPRQGTSRSSAAAVWATVAAAALYWLSGARTGSLWPLPSSPATFKYTVRTSPSLDFADQSIGAKGTTLEWSLQVGAAEPGPLVVKGAALSDPESTDFAITQDACSGAQLDAGQACTLEVTFDPKVAGVHTGLLMVTAAHLDHPLQTNLRGTAIQPLDAISAALSARLDFGRVPVGSKPVTRQLPLEVASVGATPLMVQAATLSDTETTDFTITSDGCAGAKLGAGQACTIEVSFNPAQEGLHVGLLSVPTNMGERPLQAELKGIVTPAPPVDNKMPRVVDQSDLPVHPHGGQVTEAVPISNPLPLYPKDAIRSGLEGVVQLSALISRDGSVRNVNVESGDQVLAAAAVSAVSQWRYKPTELDGHPIDDPLKVAIKFTLKEPLNPPKSL